MFYYLFLTIYFYVIMASKIKHIVISGGGAAGFAFYGALKHTHTNGIWNIADIESIYSTSAGSIISVFLTLGYDWKTIDDYIVKRPWNQVYKCELPMALQAIQNQGLFNRHVILDTFKPLFLGKDISIDVTLKELYDYNQKELHFITTDYESFDYVDVSYKTHPEWSVVDAVYASCCLPLLFSPLYKDSKVYFDGGIRMNYPLHVCLNAGCDPAEIIGIRRIDPESVVNKTLLPSYSLFDVINKLFHQYSNKIEIALPEKQIQYQYDIRFLSMDLNAIFHCLSDEEERIRLIEFGRISTIESETI